MSVSVCGKFMHTYSWVEDQMYLMCLEEISITVLSKLKNFHYKTDYQFTKVMLMMIMLTQHSFMCQFVQVICRQLWHSTSPRSYPRGHWWRQGSPLYQRSDWEQNVARCCSSHLPQSAFTNTTTHKHNLIIKQSLNITSYRLQLWVIYWWTVVWIFADQTEEK